MGQCREGNRDAEELQAGRDRPERHPGRPALLRADKRHRPLHEGKGKGKDEGEMAEFRDHARSIGAQSAGANGLRADVAGL